MIDGPQSLILRTTLVRRGVFVAVLTLCLGRVACKTLSCSLIPLLINVPIHVVQQPLYTRLHLIRQHHQELASQKLLRKRQVFLCEVRLGVLARQPTRHPVVGCVRQGSVLEQCHLLQFWSVVTLPVGVLEVVECADGAFDGITQDGKQSTLVLIIIAKQCGGVQDP